MLYQATWGGADSSALLLAISNFVSSMEAIIRKGVAPPNLSKLSFVVRREEEENIPDEVFYFVSSLSIGGRDFEEKHFSLVFPAGDGEPFFLLGGEEVTSRRIFNEVVGKALVEHAALCARQLSLMTEK